MNVKPVRWLACAVAMIPATAALAAPTAVQILQKAQQASRSAKTYQATMLMDMNGGQMGTMAMRMEVKSVPPNRTRVKMTPIGKPTGAMAMGAGMANTEVFDDGTNTFIYFPGMKQYMKQPSVAGARRVPGQDMRDIKIDTANTNYKLLPSASVGGRKVYVVQATPKGAARPGQPKKMVIYVDQATYRMRQMRITTPMGNGSDMQVKVTVQSERLNAPIPASVFKFQVPPGATQMQAPTGAPGAGARPPSVR